MKRLAEDVAGHARNLVLASLPGVKQDLPDHEVRALAQAAAEHDATQLARVFELLQLAEDEVSKAANPRHALEVALLRAVASFPRGLAAGPRREGRSAGEGNACRRRCSVRRETAGIAQAASGLGRAGACAGRRPPAHHAEARPATRKRKRKRKPKPDPRTGPRRRSSGKGETPGPRFPLAPAHRRRPRRPQARRGQRPRARRPGEDRPLRRRDRLSERRRPRAHPRRQGHPGRGRGCLREGARISRAAAPRRAGRARGLFAGGAEAEAARPGVRRPHRAGEGAPRRSARRWTCWAAKSRTSAIWERSNRCPVSI